MTLLSSPNAFIYMYVQYKSFLYTTLSYIIWNNQTYY